MGLVYTLDGMPLCIHTHRQTYTFVGDGRKLKNPGEKHMDMRRMLLTFYFPLIMFGNKL